ncbi:MULTISPECIES: hypothetical protein [unclassified Sporosarcina]|nr:MULTISPECIES: hypothetical protein [unclassified Sporosarcina]
MTDYEYLVVCTIGLVMIAFMLGSLWEHAGQEIKNEEDLSSGK